MIDSTIFTHKKVRFHTLGCKLNFAESSSIGVSLKNAGYETVKENEQADLLIINTCSVTELADKKCRNAIRSEISRNPEAFVIVTGCYAQLKPDNIAQIEGVDVVLGSNEKYKLNAFLDRQEKSERTEIHVSKLTDITSFYPSFSGTDRTRCFLKIQDGCDYFCAYCTIPFARGLSRSCSVKDTVRVAEKALENGARELILTGVNIGDFGKQTGESLLYLLKALDAIEGDFRIRVGSVEPNLLTHEMIKYMAVSKRIAPHFHIPLQSGSDKILQLMNRRYNTSLFSDRIEAIRLLLPDAFIGIDVITGVNGETEKHYEETYQYLLDIPVSGLHVFSYSERKGTKAVKFSPKVTPQKKKERSKKLKELSDTKRVDFYRKQIGKEEVVLFEKQQHGSEMFGFTGNYLKIKHHYSDRYINRFTKILITGYDDKSEALNCKIIEHGL